MLQFKSEGLEALTVVTYLQLGSPSNACVWLCDRVRAYADKRLTSYYTYYLQSVLHTVFRSTCQCSTASPKSCMCREELAHTAGVKPTETVGGPERPGVPSKLGSELQ